MNELLTAVGTALDGGEPGSCPRADADGDGHVGMTDLMRAVRASLEGCPHPFEDLGVAAAIPVEVLRRGDPWLINREEELEAFNRLIGLDLSLPADFNFATESLAIVTYANAEPNGGGPVIAVRQKRSGLFLTVKKVVPGQFCIFLEDMRRRRYTKTMVQLVRTPHFATAPQIHLENQIIERCCGCCI